ncbi:MAG: hypothetical protein L6Q60_08410 [Rhodocyclaceae bacterium]|nr:hypothetical protein [Rhodocyclaceae bacterium]
MRLSHSLAAALGIVCSASAYALPTQWDPFLDCTKSFVPVSRPARPMETVVAERVVTTCVRVGPPSLPSVTDRVAGITPGGGTANTVLDTPCPKIPETINGLQSKISAYADAIRQIDSAIAAGNEAQIILGDTISALTNESTRQDRVCARATGSYQVAHKKKMRELRAFCQRGSSANRADCLDAVDAEATIAPSVWPLFEKMNAECSKANEIYIKLQETKALSAKYKSDLTALQAERQKLNVTKIRTQRLLNTLNQELANCANP